MIFERENTEPIESPSAESLERELRKLKTEGKSTFASLTAKNSDYLQAAGSRAGLFVERREAQSQKHFRAYQSTPVVPFEDGTSIDFSAGRVQLTANEWFQMRQVVELFVAYLNGQAEPAYFMWRDVTDIVTSPTDRAVPDEK